MCHGSHSIDYDVFSCFITAKMKWKKLHCERTPPDRRLGHTAVIVYGQVGLWHIRGESRGGEDEDSYIHHENLDLKNTQILLYSLVSNHATLTKVPGFVDDVLHILCTLVCP